MTAQTGDTPAAPQLAVSVALERDGRYLLVLRANPPAQHMYAFPGGRVDPGEALEAAALRELEEETGLKASNFRPFMTFDLSADDPSEAGKPSFILTVFLADDPGGTAVAQDDAKAVGWFTPEEIRELPVPQSMTSCMDRLAQALPTP
ncbi:ADP-ribose pyrophosphatase YjhB (NUDIX family) [Hoeflea halophila]|uniref:ADP-ribose pyrophosphatase YjhB (NUDIX family) n=1 Tax=Hoeflea halophila TaxID=714899 RepID=A0A286HM53_9HYPH|nr:NUDIX hydrolase [Hoeflea halophila]SOE08858.1 ADP-ribose pyrophosphatase YjhB (NUDIX family) [Hoeflea halophila]